MPWNVQLEDENCEAIEKGVTIWGFIPEEQSKSFELLRFVDPYGDTVFNRLQMTVFIEEWTRLEEASKQNAQHDKWQAVRRLALKCQSEPHTYLRFVGD